MTVNDILHWIGTASLLLYGVASAIKPHWVAGLLENGLSSGRGISEFRVAHGSMVGLSLFALYLNHPLVYHALGWGCIGAASVRLVSYVPDRPIVNLSYLTLFAAEITLGIFLLV